MRKIDIDNPEVIFGIAPKQNLTIFVKLTSNLEHNLIRHRALILDVILDKIVHYIIFNVNFFILSFFKPFHFSNNLLCVFFKRDQP